MTFLKPCFLILSTPWKEKKTVDRDSCKFQIQSTSSQKIEILHIFTLNALKFSENIYLGLKLIVTTRL